MTAMLLTLEPVYNNKHKNHIVINRKDDNVADYIDSKGGKIVVPQEVRLYMAKKVYYKEKHIEIGEFNVFFSSFSNEKDIF